MIAERQEHLTANVDADDVRDALWLAVARLAASEARERQLLEALRAARSLCHCGGTRKNVPSGEPCLKPACIAVHAALASPAPARYDCRGCGKNVPVNEVGDCATCGVHAVPAPAVEPAN
jgi:hypothetical protein